MSKGESVGVRRAEEKESGRLEKRGVHSCFPAFLIQLDDWCIPRFAHPFA
jgi:hypothetical protein